MSKLKTASFVVTLPLSCEEWQKARLDTLFRVCGQISNNLINDRRKALEQMERTKQWQAIQFEIAVLRDQKKKKLLNEKAVDALLAPWYNNHTKAGTLDFSGVPAFLVTNVLKVHCSNPNYKGFR